MTEKRIELLADTTTLLILERGAEWPSWAKDLRARAVNSAVELQSAEETTPQFYKRVEARLEEFAAMAQRVVAVGYVCSLASLGRKSMRRELCARLLRAIHEGDSAELILAGGSWETSGQAGIERHRLIDLWSDLSGRLPGRLVSVRFEEPPCESGVFFAADRLNRPSAGLGYRSDELGVAG